MSNTPAAGLTAPDGAVAMPTELDARRELAREFQIEHLLGQAPIAYLARDDEDRVLTLKVVPRALFEESADEFLERVTLIKRLDHPHIARLYGAGTTENFLWCATRYVEGRTLASLLRTVGSMELAACLRIFEQVASALDYAHRRGVSHGAVSPECIVVDANEWVLVSDFGAAALPESANVGEGSPAADQRALALLIRQCLTGESAGARARPSAGGGRDGGVPLHVSQALRRAMSARAADQFPSVLDLVAALDDRGGEPGGGGARPEPRPVWFGAKPHSARKGGSPLVIADSDQDPAAPTPRGGRLVAVAALVVVLAIGATWINRWWAAPAPAPAAPPSRAQPAPVHAPDPPPRSPLPVPTSADSLATVALAQAVAPPPTRRLVPPPTPPRPAPAPAPRRPPARVAAPVPAPDPEPPTTIVPERRSTAEPALLSINAIPWGSVYIDGRPVGNTPQLDLPVPPGQHRLRVERQGYRAYERVIDVAAGQRLRITDIALVER